MEIRRKKPVIGDFIGYTAMTIDEITPEVKGFVRYQGEMWRAKSQESIEPGRKVVIKGRMDRCL